MSRYNPKEVEPKWQAKWAEDKLYEASDTSSKPKRYVLEYFPYPSGAAMHVGHVRNYTIGDVLSRFARMNGYNVLHPMGWDAFGLPAENYAIKTGISPKVAIKQNTYRFKKQLVQMGFGYDWSREFASSDPDYYRWTQWFFLLLYKRGLAYQKESLQWWCPFDKTVLANEQVENGKCWRCGSEVEKKLLKQWFFKITDYADRLANDLDNVDWSESIKTMQRNWIGRSKGAEIDFKVDGSDKIIKVFTTRPDTIFGATFMVVAPEYLMANDIVTDEHRVHVSNYLKEVQAKSDIERQETNREKTGVFTGAYAINPVNDQKIPIWVADYVLSGYGTGAIMAVPAHDERDLEFAKQFNLSIKPVVAPSFNGYHPEVIDRPTVMAVLHDSKTDKYCMLHWSEKATRKAAGLDLPGGGVDGNETITQAAQREITEETGYSDVTVTDIVPAAIVVYFRDHDGQAKRGVKNLVLAELNSPAHEGPTKAEAYEQGVYEVLWLSRQELLAAELPDSIALALDFAFNGAIHIGEGVMINSGAYDNLPTSEAREKIVADLETKGAAQERVNYKIRDWLISRQRYWGAPIPIVHCEKCGTQPVPENQLPVLLPDVDKFEPSGNGQSPLAQISEFVQTTCPNCGGPAKRDTDTMDGFACSSWYFLRFADPHNNEQAFDKVKAKYWLPVDDYIGGAEHAVMHLLYARMWTKVMYDAGLIDFNEPFKTLRNQGMILAPDGQKMSKSKGNTIEPDGLIEQGYGADAIRIMELFIGPWNQSASWSVEGLGGSYHFLQRVWTLVQNSSNAQGHIDEQQTDEKEIYKATHQAIKSVTYGLENLGFNVAVADLMEYVNNLYKLSAQDKFANQKAWQFAVETLLKLLAPFAPHIAEELWHQLGHEDSIHISEWPKYDEQYLVSETMIIVAQVNGKVRAELTVPSEADEIEIVAQATANERVKPYLEGKEIKKTVYVNGKLVNFVV